MFIRVSAEERRVLDSWIVQRLRHIHQLALTYLVYPGATHKRFEHSLGVMHLASQIFDTITASENLNDEERDAFAELRSDSALKYWKQVLRLAALFHDIGHLPMSHAAEKQILPPNYSHENLTIDLIRSDEMNKILRNFVPHINIEHLIKVAVGREKAPDLDFTKWESLMSEIIVGDAFGADRMDYLLRDAYHLGVEYGRFDHHRLIDTLRILKEPPPDNVSDATEFALGVDRGGSRSAEALLLARYFMYSQVYFHPVRKSYDMLLGEFFADYFSEGKYPTNVSDHLKLTDNQILSQIQLAAENSEAIGHDPARRILNREHFKVLYDYNPGDIKLNSDCGNLIFAAAVDKFGAASIRRYQGKISGQEINFPIRQKNGTTASALSVSSVLTKLPSEIIDIIFVVPEKRDSAIKWLNQNKQQILSE